MLYTIEIHPDALADIARLPKRFRRQIDKKIRSLAQNPRPTVARPLRGSGNEGLWRTRCGNYRIIYRIQQEGAVIVYVVKVGDRKKIYDGL